MLDYLVAHPEKGRLVPLSKSSSARERLIAAVAYLIRARCSGPRLLREGGVSLTIDQVPPEAVHLELSMEPELKSSKKSKVALPLEALTAIELP